MFRYSCIYVSGLIQAVLILPLRVALLPVAARQFGFSVVRVFLWLASLCGVLPLVLVRVSSDRSLFFSTFVLGGGVVECSDRTN